MQTDPRGVFVALLDRLGWWENLVGWGGHLGVIGMGDRPVTCVRLGGRTFDTDGLLRLE